MGPTFSHQAPEDSDALLQSAAEGDTLAVSRLLNRHRARLKRMVVVRLDDRLAARVDPSDVVQETLIEAARVLPNYARERPLPFYPWLRHLALQRLAQLRRKHLETARRRVDREVEAIQIPDRSAWQLADRIVTSETGPAGKAIKAERRQAVHDALLSLPQLDRELLVLLYLEQLKAVDIAAVLGLLETTIRMRHLRALRRMRDSLKNYCDE